MDVGATESNMHVQQRDFRAEAIGKCEYVLVLLGGTFLSSPQLMAQLIQANKKLGSPLVPIDLQSSTSEAFKFPGKCFYTDELPSIYWQASNAFQSENVSLADMRLSLHNLFSKIAIKLAENDSGINQRAAIQSIAKRLNKPEALVAANNQSKQPNHRTLALNVAKQARKLNARPQTTHNNVRSAQRSAGV